MFAVERYRRAESVADAIRLLAEDPFSIPIAGGTDIRIKISTKLCTSLPNERDTLSNRSVGALL